MRFTVVGGGPGGLYFALLAKKRWPQHEITVYERNRPDDTFGFGVVFSDETLEFLRDHDEPVYEAIRASFAWWDDIGINYRGEVIRVAGNGFCGCSRLTLLRHLHARCRELGVRLVFEHEVDDLDAFADSDLIVAADGINSAIRSRHEADFGTTIDWRRNWFCWLGSTREMDAFNYFFRETPHGVVIAHTYQYQPGASTWVIETTPECWQGHGFGEMSEPEYIAAIEAIFAEELAGHRLIGNRSIWRRFPGVRNARWSKDNIVLLGDAQHSAHYSIGSGTKLAMESAIALVDSLAATATVPAALEHFEATRREEVERLQHAADVSLAWFEAIDDHWGLAPEQFAFQLMSRSKRITYENLQLRDRGFVERCERWFIDSVRRDGHDIGDATPPMFAPLRVRGLTLANRVAMSPMAQYSATDGLPDDWHFVHYTSRALGGAGLVYTEMTCPAPEARITPGCTGLWNEAQRDAWARIVEFIHQRTPAKVAIQLGHAGRKGSTRVAWEGMDQPLDEGNWPLVSASPLPYLPGVSQVPREMTRADMDAVTAQFVRSAELAEEAGFDWLELHMAHGYLLASFLSPLTNRRSDDYGGPVGNRLRFPLEVFEAVRAVWPADKPMSVRISATDWHPDGLTDEDLIAICAAFRDAGVDVINVSTGQTVPDERPVYGRMFQVPFADHIRHRVGVPTMVAGNVFDADQVNTVILAGRADLVALARPHLNHPYFTLEAAAWYGHEAQPWPAPYLAGRNQAFLLAARERAELEEMRRALRPPSHAPEAQAPQPPDSGRCRRSPGAGRATRRENL